MIAYLPHLCLTAFGLFFLYTGFVSFQRPESFARMLSLEAMGYSGRVEIRAQYGGFFFASALSQFAPVAGLMSMKTALIVALVIFGGLILGRLAALFTPRQGDKLSPIIRSLYWIDSLGFIAALASLIVIGADSAIT